MSELTVQEARRRFSYNAETGTLVRRTTVGKHKAGQECKSQRGNGYYQVEVAGKNYYAHRLIWFLVTGSWPKGTVDHRDGNGLNNRWDNLRDVTQGVNLQNQRAAKTNNKIGLLGVSTRNGRFFSRISVNKNLHYLGEYDTPEAAHAAYLAAKRILHEGNTI